MNPQGWRRILAWLVDWLCFLVWLVLLAAIGVPLYLSGVTGGWSALTTNVVSALVTAVPLTIFLAVLESGDPVRRGGAHAVRPRRGSHGRARLTPDPAGTGERASM